MNKNFQEMFAKAKQEKRGSLIGFATGMDPNYKISKKILNSSVIPDSQIVASVENTTGVNAEEEAKSASVKGDLSSLNVMFLFFL